MDLIRWKEFKHFKLWSKKKMLKKGGKEKKEQKDEMWLRKTGVFSFPFGDWWSLWASVTITFASILDQTPCRRSIVKSRFAHVMKGTGKLPVSAKWEPIVGNYPCGFSKEQHLCHAVSSRVKYFHAMSICHVSCHFMSLCLYAVSTANHRRFSSGVRSHQRKNTHGRTDTRKNANAVFLHYLRKVLIRLGNHSGSEQPRKGTSVSGHSLIRSLVRLHRSFPSLWESE